MLLSTPTDIKTALQTLDAEKGTHYFNMIMEETLTEAKTKHEAAQAEKLAEYRESFAPIADNIAGVIVPDDRAVKDGRGNLIGVTGINSWGDAYTYDVTKTTTERSTKRQGRKTRPTIAGTISFKDALEILTLDGTGCYPVDSNGNRLNGSHFKTIATKLEAVLFTRPTAHTPSERHLPAIDLI
jgi:hypothetical protein